MSRASFRSILSLLNGIKITIGRCLHSYVGLSLSRWQHVFDDVAGFDHRVADDGNKGSSDK